MKTTALLILALVFASCEKETKENPQPTQPITYTIQITGNTPVSETKYNGTRIVGGNPLFTLKTGESFTFTDHGMTPTDNRTTIIYLDGTLLKKWDNQSGTFTLTYTAK